MYHMSLPFYHHNQRFFLWQIFATLAPKKKWLEHSLVVDTWFLFFKCGKKIEKFWFLKKSFVNDFPNCMLAMIWSVATRRIIGWKHVKWAEEVVHSEKQTKAVVCFFSSLENLHMLPDSLLHSLEHHKHCKPILWPLFTLLGKSCKVDRLLSEILKSGSLLDSTQPASQLSSVYQPPSGSPVIFFHINLSLAKKTKKKKNDWEFEPPDVQCIPKL